MEARMIIGGVLALLVVLNLLFFAMGIYSDIVFWIVLLASYLIMRAFLRSLNPRKKKK